MTNCSGANVQYDNNADCLTYCAAARWPAGMAGATSGNSLACRIYHTGAAAGDAVTHCAHAGPTGGDKDPTDTAGEPCGDGCEAFCAIAQSICKGTNSQYADVAACTMDCRTFAADTAAYSTSDTSKNDFGCRMYHLSVAATDADHATMHCSHIKSTSPVCID